jgi:hypothetical protein
MSLLFLCLQAMVSIWFSKNLTQPPNNNNNNDNHGSTALYGLGPPLYEVTWSCAFVAVSDQPTGRAVRLNPDVTASQSGDLGEKWPLNFAYETYLFMPVRLFYMP